jgi:hypothetical protein
LLHAAYYAVESARGTWFRIDSCVEGDCGFFFTSEKEETVVFQTDKGLLQIEHGSKDQYHIIKRKGSVLISCHCNQEECVQYTPNELQKTIILPTPWGTYLSLLKPHKELDRLVYEEPDPLDYL